MGTICCKIFCKDEEAEDNPIDYKKQPYISPNNSSILSSVDQEKIFKNVIDSIVYPNNRVKVSIHVFIGTFGRTT